MTAPEVTAPEVTAPEVTAPGPASRRTDGAHHLRPATIPSHQRHQNRGGGAGGGGEVEACDFARLTGAGGLTRQPGLDGLRGLAVAAVVVFHLDLGVAGGGFLGVSLFFTLSGVLIGTLVLDELVTTGRFALGRFWARRARRLLPPLLLVLAAVAVARPFTVTLAATSGGDVVAGVLDVANWHFLAEGTSYADLFGGPSALLHLWSLAIEEQFYLVLGIAATLLAGRAARPARTVFVTAAVGAALSFTLPIVVGNSVDRTYYGTDTRAGELLLGVAAAAVIVSAKRRQSILVHTRMVATAATLALAGTIVLWQLAEPDSQALRTGLLPLTATASLLLVLGAVVPVGPVAALARLSMLRWLGRISYSLYLVHWPVIVVAEQLAPDHTVWRAVITVAVSLLLAQLLVLLVEGPTRRLRRAPLSLGVAAAVALTAVAAGVVVEGRTNRSAALLADLTATGGQTLDALPDTSPSMQTTPRLALYGDSVGFSLLLGLGASRVDPVFERAPSEVDLGCGIALSPSPPAESPGLCDDPAGRFAASATANDVSIAVMISCQWELVTQPLPGGDGRPLTIGDDSFDAHVLARFGEVADALSTAGVERILWTSCPHLSGTVGVDGLAPELVESRAPGRVERLNELIAALAEQRPDVEVLPFGEWVDGRVDDAVIRPDGSHYEYRRPNPAVDVFVSLVNQSLTR